MLKPCPFCNSDELMYAKYADQGGDYYQVKCKDCGAHGPKTELFQDTAAEYWNNRVSTTVHRDIRSGTAS